MKCIRRRSGKLSPDPLDTVLTTPLTAWEIAAVAAKLVQSDDRGFYIFGQIPRLEGLDDDVGVATWRAIAAKVQAIRNAPAV